MTYYPLFSRFPQLGSHLAREELVKGMTPVEVLSQDQHLWVKRDDLTHPLYGGNKVRKLELILGEAKRRGCRRLVTFGAIGTNHGVATSIFARRAGLEATVILFDQPTSPTVRRNLELMAAAGAELWYRRSLLRTVLSYYLEAPLRYPGAMRLFAGGSGLLGTLAFVNAALELGDQVQRDMLPKPDRIIVAVGSSATLAGLALGCALMGWSTAVIGVRVAPSHLGPFPACTPATIRALIKEANCFLVKNGIPPPEVAFELDEQEYGDGYGVESAAGRAAGRVFQESTGLALEGTYTAKAFAAALRYRARFPAEDVLYWHTFNSAETQHFLRPATKNRIPRALRPLLVV